MEFFQSFPKNYYNPLFVLSFFRLERRRPADSPYLASQKTLGSYRQRLRRRFLMFTRCKATGAAAVQNAALARIQSSLCRQTDGAEIRFDYFFVPFPQFSPNTSTRQLVSNQVSTHIYFELDSRKNPVNAGKCIFWEWKKKSGEHDNLFILIFNFFLKEKLLF